MSSQQLFLDQEYVLDGVTLTGAEIKEHVIDSILYRKHLQELKGDDEIDIFLELSCFINDRTDVGNLISGSSTFSKTSLNIWKFTVHVLLKPGLENLEHY